MGQLAVWIMQTGEPLHTDGGNPRPMRAMNLANALISSGHKVVIWSSLFSHQEKNHRVNESKKIRLNDQLEIRFIHSPGYKRNIGFGRLYDHLILAINLHKLLRKERTLPDVAFIGFPPIETSFVISHWLHKKKIPFLLDVKDQWPDIFLEPLHPAFKSIARVLLFPYAYITRKSMMYASGMTTMAESFLQWSLNYSGRIRNNCDMVVPLTSPSSSLFSVELEQAKEWCDSVGIKNNANVFRVLFVGSHMDVFDFDPIRIAAKLFEDEFKSVEFVICGDGGSSSVLRNTMEGLSNVHFTGWIDRAKIEILAQRSQAAVIPYKNIDSFMRSIPNKAIDALSLGLPILSPLKGEISNLIINNKVGLRYGTDTGRSIYDVINILIDDKDLQLRISANAIELFQREYTYEKVYTKLVSHIEQLAIKN